MWVALVIGVALGVAVWCIRFTVHRWVSADYSLDQKRRRRKG